MITDLIEYVAFRGERLTLVWQDEEAYVAIRPICERLGLNWKSQHRKLTAPETLAVVHMMTTTGADNKRYDMTCLHVMDVPFWLATIAPSRVKPELADVVRLFRQECKLVLFNHVKARLLGERDAMQMSLVRLQAEVIARKPRWVKVQRLTEHGLSFEEIWRALRVPRRVVQEAVEDLMRIGLLAKAPSGTPAPTPVRPRDNQMPLPLDA